jgi:hypothetical protein
MGPGGYDAKAVAAVRLQLQKAGARLAWARKGAFAGKEG